MNDPLTLYFHRDFDGMASAAILATALEETGKEDHVLYEGVNFDRTLHWDDFAEGERFGVVDFHFHPRATYWFDHHPTTFLKEEDQNTYQDDANRCFDPKSPSCPPIIIQHARDHWNWEASEAFLELSHWSDIIDSASFETAEQAVFGKDPALRIMRALTCAPDLQFHNRVIELMKSETLMNIAANPEVDKCFARACRNRDNAIENFPPTIMDRTMEVLLADLRSKKIRRDRFAPFYLYPEIQYAVTMLPTRAGVHITAASNPWNRPKNPVHLGELLKKYGGGGHLSIGGCNPPSSKKAVIWSREIYNFILQSF